jgi:diguanylate cyclase (GGDEF)-like protein
MSLLMLLDGKQKSLDAGDSSRLATSSTNASSFEECQTFSDLQAHQPSAAARVPHRRPLPGVTKLLVVMMSVPLIAVAISMVVQLKSELRNRRQAVEVTVQARRLEDLSALYVAIRQESASGFLTVGARKFGIPIQMGPLLLGMDVEADSVSSRQDVDRLLTKLGAASSIKRKEVVRAREVVDNPAMVNLESDVYSESLRAGLANVEQQMRRLQAEASTLGNDKKLLNAQFAADHATRALSESLDQSGPLVGIAVGAPISRDGIGRMLASTTNLRSELLLLRETAGLPPEVVKLTNRVLNGAEHKIISDQALLEVTPKQAVLNEDSRALLAAVPKRSLDLIELARASTQATARRADELVHTAQRRLNITSAFLFGSMLLSVFVALMLGRTITRTLGQLERRARELVEGNPSTEPLSEKGPRELAVTASALNQLVAEYAVLGKQAEALAKGDLTDESFQHAPTGPIGVAVYGAVRRLVTSIHVNEQTRSSLKHEATHDPLTGVLNRSGINEVLDHYLGQKMPCSVVFVDLDHFKLVNDTFGHLVGDELLRLVAQRLTHCLRDHDSIGRMGGDEFLMVCPGVEDETHLRQIAQRVITEIVRDFTVSDIEIAVGASVGISFCGPDDDAHSLLARADRSLYSAKSDGRGRVGSVTAASMRATDAST